MDIPSPGPRLPKPRGLTPEQFDKLLACLGADRESAAEQYEQIRRALLTFFEFRGVVPAEDAADEVFDRVARRLAEGREIFTASPRNYFYAVARNLWRERLARPVSEVALEPESVPALHQPRNPLEILEDVAADRWHADRMRCLASCLQTLDETERVLIVGYYQGSGRAKIENRQALAARLGIPVAALRVRACRLRDKLETCVKRCLNPLVRPRPAGRRVAADE